MMISGLRTAAGLVALGAALALSGIATAAEPVTTAGKLAPQPAENQHMDQAHIQKAQEMINGGLTYLLAARNEDGGWDMGGGTFRPAATAFVLKVLVQHPDFGPDNDIVKAGFKRLLSYQQKDGGIYEPKDGVNNYETSIAVMALAASGDPQYKPAMDKAVKFLRDIQIMPGARRPDGTIVKEDSDDVGGANYGNARTTNRPDMSNMTYWMEAMHDAGVKGDDPAMQKALGFLTRVQNNSETSKTTIAAEGPNDGGFPYSLAESKAGKGPGERGLRSYGTMTYAGFKSMLYAGVDKKDPRVAAAFTWIRTYWRLDSNPNMPQKQSRQGLFYYYNVFAKALRAWGEAEIKDIDGVKHNWRQELVDALAKSVRKDGSWSNAEADRWEEGSPILVTCYSVMALQETLRK